MPKTEPLHGSIGGCYQVLTLFRESVEYCSPILKIACVVGKKVHSRGKGNRLGNALWAQLGIYKARRLDASQAALAARHWHVLLDMTASTALMASLDLICKCCNIVPHLLRPCIKELMTSSWANTRDCTQGIQSAISQISSGLLATPNLRPGCIWSLLSTPGEVR